MTAAFYGAHEAAPACRGTSAGGRPRRAAPSPAAAPSRATSMVSAIIAPLGLQPAPAAHDAAVDGDEVVRHHLRAVLERLRHTRRQRGAVIAVGDDHLVVVGEQVNGGAGGPRRSPRGAAREPVGLAVDGRGREARRRRLDAALRIAHRQPGPPGEVLRQRRAVAGEVAPGQLGQRLVARQRATAAARARRAGRRWTACRAAGRWQISASSSARIMMWPRRWPRRLDARRGAAPAPAPRGCSALPPASALASTAWLAPEDAPRRAPACDRSTPSPPGRAAP